MLYATPILERSFFLPIGKMNTIAINGNGVFHDQHGVHFKHPDADKWEAWGIIKVYCPSFLMAFKEGDDFVLLNKLVMQLQPYLDANMSFETALQYGQLDLRQWFEDKMDKWTLNVMAYPKALFKACTLTNTIAYNRSMLLQDIFEEDSIYKECDHTNNLICSLGRLQAVYIAMAGHYCVEAYMDDAFVPFRWHLPSLTQKQISKILSSFPQRYSDFDLANYLLGIHPDYTGAVSPDLFRFCPILSSLIAPFVSQRQIIQDYQDWGEFTTKVIHAIPDEVREVFKDFAESMNISIEQAVFSGWKMLQKDVRKRGWQFLFSPRDALLKIQMIKRHHQAAFSYFFEHQRLGARLFGGEYTHGRLINLLHVRAVIEYFNSFIGCYKFIPWKVADENFQGKYLPYNLMKTEKRMLWQSLLYSPDNIWFQQGLWLRTVLEELLKDKPSLYAKWCVPLLEKGFVKPYILREAKMVCYNVLEKLLKKEVKPP